MISLGHRPATGALQPASNLLSGASSEKMDGKQTTEHATALMVHDFRWVVAFIIGDADRLSARKAQLSITTSTILDWQCGCGPQLKQE